MALKLKSKIYNQQIKTRKLKGKILPHSSKYWEWEAIALLTHTSTLCRSPIVKLASVSLARPSTHLQLLVGTAHHRL